MTMLVGDPRTTVVVFDLDGTLVDTMDSLADLAAEVLHGGHRIAFEEARSLYVETSGVPFREQLDLIVPGEAGLDQTAEIFEFRKRAIAQEADLTRPRRHALESLRERGYQLTISSSSAQHFVEEFHQRVAFDFDLALGFAPGQTKGAQHFSITCNALDRTMDQLVFVGDSLRDAALADQSGVRFIGRLGTFSRSRFSAEYPRIDLIDDVVELPCRLEVTAS